MRAGAKTATARDFRQRPTDAEKALWQLLRDRRLAGAKFRRQHPIGPFVVDFVCLEQRLIVELDGGQHVVDEQSDRLRTALLEARGYRVIRFWNNDMLLNPDGVQQAIEVALKAPHPNPLPHAGEGAHRRSDKMIE